MPWRRKWQPTPVLLPRKSHGCRSPVGYSAWGHKRVGHNWATLLSLTHRIWMDPQVAQTVNSPPCNSGDLGSIPGWGRSPGGGHGKPLQYPCLENPMDKGAWWATFHGVAKELDSTQWLKNNNNMGYEIIHDYYFLLYSFMSILHFLINICYFYN